jgi:uncharacterized protein
LFEKSHTSAKKDDIDPQALKDAEIITELEPTLKKGKKSRKQNNKKVVETYMEGYNTGDNDKILSCLTEDVIWEMAGFFNLKGKDQFDKEINSGWERNPIITISQHVEEGNIVVAEGAVKCNLKNGGFTDALFCELFHVDNSKVKKLTTYHFEKKKA